MASQFDHLALRQEKHVSLHDLINELLVTNTLKFAANRTVVVNEIPTDIPVHTEIAPVKYLITRIIDLLSFEQKNSVIRISAKRFTDIVLVHFRENNIDNSSVVFDELLKIVPDAEKIDGYLGVTSQQDGLMTIVLTILNQEKQVVRGRMQRLVELVAAKEQLYG